MSLRIVVCVKYVPDATGDRHFADDLTIDRDDVDGLLSELDEYAVEQALQIADAARRRRGHRPDRRPGGRQGRAAQGAVHGRRQGGPRRGRRHRTAPTSSAPPLVLAKAIEKTGYDLVICGMASTDGTMGVLPALLAERLGVPQVTLLSEVSVDGRHGHGPPRRRHRHRAARGLPAGGRVGDRPVGRGPLPVLQGHHGRQEEAGAGLDLDDLDIDADEVGLAGAWTTVDERHRSARPAPPARSSRTRARAASSSPSSSPSQKFI